MKAATFRVINYVAFCATLLSAPAHAGEGILVEAIHSDDFPLAGIEDLAGQGIEVKTYNLDDGKRLTANLATGLPPNQEQAKRTLEQRFKQQGMEAVKQQFMRAFQGRIVGVQYGVSRYPAVVFNQGQAVVYGVTDLSRALAIYREWLRSQP